MHSDSAPAVILHRPLPALGQGCPVQPFWRSFTKELETNAPPLVPVAGLVPATHVSGECSVERKEGVDGRVEPGQGVVLGSLEASNFAEPDRRGLGPASTEAGEASGGRGWPGRARPRREGREGVNA